MNRLPFNLWAVMAVVGPTASPAPPAQTGTSRPEWIAVARDAAGFVLEPSGRPFTPWGFNYDHDQAGRLIEEYWESDWPRIEEDFREMRELGANVVRIHLQFGRFMRGPDEPNRDALDTLAGFAVGKPVVIEEMFPLRCTGDHTSEGKTSPLCN